MNLKQLVQTQSELLQQREFEVDTLCQQAYHLIAESEATGFTDKQALRQAMQLFSQALRQQRTALEPYIGMAYLAMLLNQNEISRKCLLTALQLSPDHPDALSLLHYLDGEITAISEPHDSKGVDLDYDVLETELFHLAHHLAQEDLPNADPHSETQTTLQCHLENLQQKVEYFEQKLSPLEDYFNTTNLRQHLKPAENCIRVCLQRLELCREMQATQQHMQNLNYALRALSDLQEPLQEKERELEKLNDQIEELSERLQRFAQDGGKITDLEHSFRILQAMLEQMQDNLDAPKQT